MTMFDNNDEQREARASGGTRNGSASASSGRTGPSAAAIGFLVLLVVSGVFILQNRERTTIDFLVFELRSRVWTAIAVAIGLGILLDRLISAWWRRRRRRERVS
jgi:hypothetical protein